MKPRTYPRCRIRNRKTQGSASGDAVQTLSEPSPATVGGTADDTNLAATGGTGTTPLIAGVAIGFVVIGGAALVVVRKKEEARSRG